jgi:hypothetical protein
MELDEFIKKTLVDIAKGVSSARSEVEELGGRLSPSETSALSAINAKRNGTDPVVYKTKQHIEFDISLQIKEENNISGKGSVKLFSVSLGVDGDTKDAVHTAHKIKFSIPMEMP